MQRRKFGREFKIEAVRLIKDRGVSVAQASRDLDVHENRQQASERQQQGQRDVTERGVERGGGKQDRSGSMRGPEAEKHVKERDKGMER